MKNLLTDWLIMCLLAIAIICLRDSWVGIVLVIVGLPIMYAIGIETGRQLYKHELVEAMQKLMKHKLKEALDGEQSSKNQGDRKSE